MNFQSSITFFISFFLLLISISCNEVEKETDTPLTYELSDPECNSILNLKSDTIRYQQQELNKSIGGYTVTFNFPVMINHDGIINTVIKRELYDSLSNSENFLNANYIEYTKEMSKYSIKNRFNWRDEESISVVFNSTTIMSLLHDDYSWRTGGAVGLGKTTGLNYDLRTGQKIELQDIMETSNKALLEAKVLSAYNQKFEKVDSIVLKQNFIIKKEGIEFIYNRFEDIPFPNGLRLLVNYCDLEDMLIEGSILEESLKTNK